MLTGHSSGKTEIRVTLKISASLERKKSAFLNPDFQKNDHLTTSAAKTFKVQGQ